MCSQFKIGTRLTAGFVFVASLSAVVGAVGSSNASRRGGLAERMYERELIGLASLAEANTALVAIGRARSNYLLATSADERERHLASMSRNSALVKERVAQARPLFGTEQIGRAHV